MKKSLLFFFVVGIFLLLNETSMAAGHERLFKEYYVGMSIDNARKISSLTLKQELAGGAVKDYYSGKAEFAGSIWSVTLSFTREKLTSVELFLNSNETEISPMVSSKLQKNDFFVPLFFTRNKAYDIIKILKNNSSKPVQDAIISEIRNSRNDKYFLCIYINQPEFDANEKNKKPKSTGIDAIFGNYPNNKCLVVFCNIGATYELVFGTKEAAYVYATSYLDVAEKMSREDNQHAQKNNKQPNTNAPLALDSIGERLKSYRKSIDAILN